MKGLLVGVVAVMATAAQAQQSGEPGDAVAGERLTFPRFSYPSWSPDGSQILYESQTGGNWDVYLMDASGIQDGGGEVRRLTDDPAANRMPSFSPDGHSIAFLSDRDGEFEVFVMHADGSGQRQLTHNDVPEIHPFWTPDGTRILFNRRRDGELIYDIRSIRPDGTDDEEIWSDEELNSFAQLSPDGSMIVFDKWVDNDETNGEIFVLHVAEGRLARLTDNAVYDGYPTWTPDGRIVFSEEVGEDFKLFLINPDGTGRRQLTFGEGSDARANVSRDGARIVFNRDIDDNINIHTIPFDS